MKKLMVAVMVAACAGSALAMPTKAELTKAQPLVDELMSPETAKFKAAGYKEKAEAAAKVGDAAAEFAKAAETEAAKFLLLKGAISFYVRGEQYDKAADMVAEMQRVVKDIPPAVVAEITGKATNRISEKKAPRLYATYRTAKLQVRASNDAKALAAKLKKVKSDALQRKYAEALAISGDWKAAYAEFAKVSDENLKRVVASEKEGDIGNETAGEFWWAYKPAMEDADDFFKAHAAAFYRRGLDAGEIAGLKKNIIENRIEGIAAEAAPSIPKAKREPREFFGFLPKTETLLWKDLALTDINKIRGWTGGYACGRHPVVSTYMKGDDKRRTYQFPFDHGPTRKCVGIELTQKEKDIYGRVIYGHYKNQSAGQDNDFDNEYIPYAATDKSNGDGYGLQDFCVVFDDNANASAEPPPRDNGEYCIIDLSGGPNAARYPVRYVKGVPKEGWTDQYKMTKLVLRKIEPGSFEYMPGRKFTITKPFYISVFELTQRQCCEIFGQPCSVHMGSARPVDKINYKMIRGSEKGLTWPQTADVDEGSLIDRLRKRTKLNFDLLTEAQWEYACRAGSTTKYYNGGTEGSAMLTIGKSASNGGRDSHASVVGSFKPNAWGLYDMLGNVWEWCLDRGNNAGDGNGWCRYEWTSDAKESEVDPKGPSTGNARILRGQSWKDGAHICGSDRRAQSNPDVCDHAQGCRLAIQLK